MANTTLFALRVDGKRTGIATHTSHGSKYKVLSDDLVKYMAAQVKLTKAEFVQFVNCTLTFQQYVALLRSRGILPEA